MTDERTSQVWPLLDEYYNNERLAVMQAKLRRGIDDTPPVRVPIGTTVDVQDGKLCLPGHSPQHLASEIAYTKIEVISTEIRNGERIYNTLVDETLAIPISETLALQVFGDEYMPDFAYKEGQLVHALADDYTIKIYVTWVGRRMDIPFRVPLELKQDIMQSAQSDPVYILSCADILAGIVTETTLQRMIKQPCEARVVPITKGGLIVFKMLLCGEAVSFYLTTQSGRLLNPEFANYMAGCISMLPANPKPKDLRKGLMFMADGDWFAFVESREKDGSRQWRVWRSAYMGEVSLWLDEGVILRTIYETRKK